MSVRVLGAARMRPAAYLSLMLAGLLALAGCGSSSKSSSSSSTESAAAPPASSGTTGTSSTPSSSSSPSATPVAIAANPEGLLRYTTSSLSVKAGSVLISFTNDASVEHNLTVATSSGTVLGATPTFAGGSKAVLLNLKRGVYKFYCTVPGHRAAGMEGTLTVQ